MLIATLAIIVGFIALVWSADMFIGGAASIAENWGMPPVIIGLTVVSVGTSAPEIIVAINAALANQSELAVGNALGSNLANIGLVLGITTLIVPLVVLRIVIQRELPILLVCTFFGGFVLWDGYLSRLDGGIFLISLIMIMWILIRSQTREPNADIEAGIEDFPHFPAKKAWVTFSIGLLILIGSSKLLVWGATGIALSLGVSTLVIGLTVVAVGTSLPELAATVASALKGHEDIAIGNIIGSNLFNLLGVMAVPALINPVYLGPEVLTRDYASMASITFILAGGLYFSWYFRRGEGKECKHRIGRVSGALLLTLYGMYYYWLFATT